MQKWLLDMITAMALSACVALASKSYNVDPSAIRAVLLAPVSKNGIGPMHIPPAWLPILGRIGFSLDQVRHHNCTNIEAGTWILAYEAWRYHRQTPHPSPTSPPFESSMAIIPHAAPRTSTKACIAEAAQLYHIQPALLMAVLRTEGGHVGQIHRNANGSYDMGPAQINSIWLPVLAKSGITKNMVLNDRCLNITIGAWILGKSMAGVSPQNPALFWQHVGNYNSNTPVFNHIYAVKVWENLK